ncbi:uncharacterized protein LOC128213071 [Mya arenaria]|uniref:uncharacterized protein LOC128213071 n=1 Tax=Mya arenaria TaxID=6604 RepID=UPI0022E58C97|nr:uncharacterized protein LOC128213071 [Mya arenaria]
MPRSVRSFTADINGHRIHKPNLNGHSNMKTGRKGPDNEGLFGTIMSFLNTYVAPPLVILCMPTLVMATCYLDDHHAGELLSFVKEIQDTPVGQMLLRIWNPLTKIDLVVMVTVLVYMAWAVIWMVVLPGPQVEGPMTSHGNIPVYRDNGFRHYIVTMTGSVLFTVVLKLSGSTPTFIYDRFSEFAALMNVLAVVVVFMLYIKGIYKPSTSDSGKTGKGFLFDYYWGTELYPRVFGIDIKVFTNCRFGMTVWPLLVLVFALKSYELHGLIDSMFVSSVLQLIYVSKFFIWEGGYYQTMDIVQDRAGFYICWGCLALVPPLYPIASRYLVSHPVELGPLSSAVLLIIGTVSIYVNYQADEQKTLARKTSGNCVIWGTKPDVIRAKHVLQSGKKKKSIILASGWWGVSRHFHYIPEVLLAACWTLPAGFSHFLPYAYLLFLTILLVHRTFRDDRKCAQKYGHFWKTYCGKVRYRIIPYVF